jgi:AcrR family transcriptional regulator
MEIKSADHEAQQAVILKAAAALFSRLGFKKTTVSDIARAAGLKKPSVYYYFKSKDEIICAVVKREGREIVAVMEAAARRDGTISEKIKAFLLARYRAFKKRKAESEISVDEIIEASSLVMKARSEAVELEIAALSHLLENAIENGEIEIDNPELFARIAIAALQGIDESFWRYGLEDQIEAGIELLVNIFFKGVLKEH